MEPVGAASAPEPSACARKPLRSLRRGCVASRSPISVPGSGPFERRRIVSTGGGRLSPPWPVGPLGTGRGRVSD